MERTNQYLSKLSESARKVEKGRRNTPKNWGLQWSFFSASNLAHTQMDMNLVVDVDEWEEIKKIVYDDNSLLSDMKINANNFASLKGSNDESERVRQGSRYSVPSSVSDATDTIQLEDISTAARVFSNDSRNIEKIQCIEAPL